MEENIKQKELASKLIKASSVVNSSPKSTANHVIVNPKIITGIQEKHNCSEDEAIAIISDMLDDNKSVDELKIGYIDQTEVEKTSIGIQSEIEQVREDVINYFGYILNQYKFKK